jgi:hypothetical protein
LPSGIGTGIVFGIVTGTLIGTFRPNVFFLKASWLSTESAINFATTISVFPPAAFHSPHLKFRLFKTEIIAHHIPHVLIIPDVSFLKRKINDTQPPFRSKRTIMFFEKTVKTDFKTLILKPQIPNTYRLTLLCFTIRLIEFIFQKVFCQNKQGILT